MKNLTPINRDHTQLFESCVGQIQNANVRNNLMLLSAQIVGNGVTYEAVMAVGRPDMVTKMIVNGPDHDELGKLYKSRMQGKAGSERRTYDEIKSMTGVCPYCGFGEVWEVDHYLPQGSYPELNVFHKNLVPICHGCNHTKLAQEPLDARRSFLHPYYDVLPNQRWLSAILTIENNGPVLDFCTNLNPPNGILASRLDHHFRMLDLPQRMKNQAARILTDLQADIDQHLTALGPNGIRDHFLFEGQEAFDRHGNCIETAAYFAAAANPDYCAGNYAI